MARTNNSSNSSDGIAIVGIGCSFPGGIESADALWEFLRQGGDGVIEIPAERWNVDAVFDPDASVPGKTACRRAGFLLDLSSFDAGFFGISPREAAVMDPQQRLLLQVAWRAFEDAGMAQEQLAGSNTGVYIGISHSDYQGIQQFGRSLIDIHTATGGALSIAANRLSHRFDFRGPSIAIDTACSSSLVALDCACTALLTGQCDTALVGGVNVMLTPDVTLTFARAGMLSADGRCKMFDASADGYVRGEGAGVVILKPLSRALVERDRIHAVIRATAVNQDGRTSTITVPSREAQITMLREACTRADVDPSRIAYVEAHGTGTAVGDPVEAEAIGTVFGDCGTRGEACLVGSIKTNIGHLEPAAGIAGLIKAILCVRKGEIPPNLHFNEPNPNIDFAKLGIRVPRALTPWPARGQSRISAVNSFGFGGTNACAIIEEPPEQSRAVCEGVSPDGSPILIPVSAASKTALKTLCARLAEAVDQNPGALLDIAGTLAVRRSHLDHRLVVVASSAQDTSRALGAFASEETPAGIITGRKSSGRRLAFVFSGQGSQWWGMGRDLLQQDALFREVVERCDRLLLQRCGWSIIEQLMLPQERSRINETTIAQPAIFALQVALTRRLAVWGIHPDAVIGHSIGEIAAAHVAGALSLPQAIEVVYHRSQLQERSRLQGGMAAVGLPVDRARAQLEKFHGQIELAAINGPELVSIAGPRRLLDLFIAELERDGNDVLCQILRVDYAFHSSQMDPLTKELRASLEELQPKALDVPLFSTVSGQTVQGEELDADYWCRNMRQPVLFKQAVDQAINAGINTFLEIGAHPSLTAAVRACLAAHNQEGIVIPTLHREQREVESLTRSVATLHVNGVSLDWKSLVAPSWDFVELPGSPWEKQVHWRESEESRAARFDGPAHPLLGSRLKSSTTIWQSEIDLKSPSYLQDHQIDGAAVFPAAGYVEMMLAAARETLGGGPCEVEEIAFYEALFLHAESSVLIETSFDEARGSVRVRSRERGMDPHWTLRATGRVRSWPMCEPAIEHWKPRIEPPVQVGRARFYRDLSQEGHTFGPVFQGVETLWYAQGWSLGKVVLPASISDADKYVLHPAQLDACLQVIRGFRGFGTARDDAPIALPLSLARLRQFRRPSSTVFARAKVVEESSTEIVAEISIIDDTGRLIAILDGFRCLRVAKGDNKQQDLNSGFYREHWVRVPARAQAGTKRPVGWVACPWLILADHGGVGDALRPLIEERGGRATLVFKGARERQIAGNQYETTGSAASLDRIMARMERPPENVVYLWPLDDKYPRLTSATLRRARRTGVEAISALVRAFERQQTKPRLWVVTTGATLPADADGCSPILHGAMSGFLRSLANEQPDYRPTLVDLDPLAISAQSVIEEMIAGGEESEIALRKGERFGLRLEPLAQSALPERRTRWDAKTRTPSFRLAMSVPGSLDNLRLVATRRADPQPGEVAIEVRAAGLNFRDVMAATGLLPRDAEHEPAWQRLGFECAGIVCAVGEGVNSDLVGRRVIAVTPGCMASHIVVSADKTCPIPRGLSFATAAAIPVAFATAHYALVRLGRLSCGERVLIHSAAGGVGLAAVGIAQARGAQIIATAGTREKRLYLHQRGVEHVFDSRSLTFADDVLWKTGGRGVDVVLNSLSGAFLEKSLSILAPGGRFVEIGKRDIYADTPLGLRALRNNSSFHAVDLAKLADEQPDLLRSEISAVLSHVRRGQLPMIPITTFPVAKAADAFRRVSAPEHMGKVVLLFNDQTVVHEQEHTPLPITSDATYLVTGGTGGLGLETGRWLVKNGARSVVLVGRSRVLSREADSAFGEMRAAGATVIHVSADIGTSTGASAALNAANRTGLPLRGIVHAAGAIDDSLIADLRPRQIRHVFDGKVLGAWHLHDRTRSLPLDFFVLYSSVAATVGSPGQAHYAAANRMLAALAAVWRAQGLAVASVAFGPIGDCGYLVRRQEVARYINNAGLQLMPAAAALDALGTMLRHAPFDATFAQINWSKLAQSFPLAANSPRMSSLSEAPAVAQVGPDQQARSALLAAPEAQRPRMVADYLHRKVATVLKVQASTVEFERPLHEIGLDSLTAFELKNRIETELGVTLPVGKFLQRPTVSAIVPNILAALNVSSQAAVQGANVDSLGPSMTMGQEALWFVSRFDPESPAYGIAACVAFRPHINDDHVDRVIHDLVLRHDNLRIAFPSDGMGPVPTELPPDCYKLNRHDVTELTDGEFSTMLHAEANKPFNLEQGPLSRLHLFRRKDRDVVLLQFHHIVADAASIAILLDEVIERYFALQAGLALPPSGQLTPFGQFVAWQRKQVDGAEGERHRNYWRQVLAGAPPSFLLPTDKQRSANPLGPGAACNFAMKGVVVEELKGLARAEGTTLFSVLLAAFNVLLHHHTGATDIVVGTPMSGRTRAEFERMVGYLVNAMPIRTQISADQPFVTVLAAADASVRSAIEHQDYPFPMIVHDIDPPRESGFSPIFQIMFGMERFHSTDPRGLAATLLNMAGPAIRYREYTVESVAVARNRAPFDITFTIEEFDGQIFGVVDYRCDLWKEETIARLVEHYQAIVHQIVACPSRRVCDFTVGQRAQRPITGRELRDAPDLLASVLQVAACQPDAAALTDAAGTLSYGSLVARIRGLAGAMTSRGIGPGCAVGICLARTNDLPLAILATLAIGAAYVPLDPSYPARRLARIIADVNLSAIVVDRESTAVLPAGAPMLFADAIVARSDLFAPVSAPEDGLAYIIHTSGSTGEPIGVEIGRSALNNFLAAVRAELPLSPADVALAVTPYSFDIAGLELLLPLTVGARVVIASESAARDGARLAQTIDCENVSMMQATPATWQMLIDADWKGNKRLIALSGGERLDPQLAAAIVARSSSLWNLYGPTESTIWSTFAEITEPDQSVPIGRPFANTYCLVVDDSLRPVAPGIPGELLIGGHGLAQGYHRRPGRTAERFVADPLAARGRVFRTGDIVRAEPDGTLHFLGRRDQQVKIRGFRIELGEIEAVLRNHDCVRNCVVLAVGDDLLNRRLAAFIESSLVDMAELDTYLRERLPRYMVPDSIQAIPAIPRLPNGKIDRQRLAARARFPILDTPTGQRNTPASAVETQLLALLEELLGHKQIGCDSDFFVAGGTSLLGMRYVSRINEIYAVGLGAADLLRAPTAGAMAQLITALLTRGSVAQTQQSGSSLATPLGRKLWRPLPMLRAEGAFDEIHAAAVAYLPDDMRAAARAFGIDRSIRHEDDPQWFGVCRHSLGTIALLVIPRFGHELLADPERAVPAVDAAADYATRLGARTLALTGLIPAVTDFGRALDPREGLAITTGHATTASAVVLTAATLATAMHRELTKETMAFVGLGAVGTAALRLMLAQAIHPSELILCDVPVKAAELERLAHEVCSEFRYEGRVEIALASGNVPDEVYRSRFVIAATNVPGVLDVERLSPGTIVVDDSFPHCFETDRAISRMSSCGDVLLVDGGLVSPPGSMEWNVMLPPAVNSLVVGHFQESMLPRQNAITACILSALLSARHGATATVGPVSVKSCVEHWERLAFMGIGAAPLQCASWSPTDAHIASFGARFSASE